MKRIQSEVAITFAESKKYGEDEYFDHHAILESDKELSESDLKTAITNSEDQRKEIFNDLNDGNYGELFSCILEELEKLGYKRIKLPRISETVEVSYQLA